MQMQLLLDKINFLTVRERVLIFVACIVLVQQIWDSSIWIPLQSEREQVAEGVFQSELKINQLQAEKRIFSGKLSIDPDLKLRHALLQLEEKLKKVNSKTQKASSQLVSPEQMARLLEQLMITESQLKLLSLKTIDAVALIPLSEEEQQSGKASRYQVYRHEFSIEFSGNYLATLRYLEALEQLPWTFFWDEIDYHVDSYPDSRITLKLYTLSLSTGWIGV